MSELISTRAIHTVLRCSHTADCMMRTAVRAIQTVLREQCRRCCVAATLQVAWCAQLRERYRLYCASNSDSVALQPHCRLHDAHCWTSNTDCVARAEQTVLHCSHTAKSAWALRGLRNLHNFVTNQLPSKLAILYLLVGCMASRTFKAWATQMLERKRKTTQAAKHSLHLLKKRRHIDPQCRESPPPIHTHPACNCISL
jgi:hypothetical protein